MTNLQLRLSHLVLIIVLSLVIGHWSFAAQLEPNSPGLKPHLQLWLRADSLKLQKGAAVNLWPDQSGRGHDLAPTQGIRRNGAGTAPTWEERSGISGRPAVRFRPGNGMAGSPDHPLALKGNAALTIVIVGKFLPHNSRPPFDNVLFIGDPAGEGTGNPGRPTAALIEIDRSKGEASLDFAGGWSHDAKFGARGMAPLQAGPVILTFVKPPGPMTNVRVFHNGTPGPPPAGTSAALDLKHRSDVGVSIGRVATWGGSINAELAEVIVFNKALAEAERKALETTLGERYNLSANREKEIAAATRHFTPAQKAHWAFQPVKRPEPPPVKDTAWVKTPIDRFVLAKLEQSSQKPGPSLEPLALLRRVTFDLIGLPPKPKEIEAFEKDLIRNPESAFQTVVDRLLASPHYGERWGRRWMDVARYADTTAVDGNFIMRQAWRYRDWIVNSLNADLPYDQFIVHQLAGDLLPDKEPSVTLQRTIATGFLMVGPKSLAETNKEQVKLDIADEQIDVTGRAFLGLTIACARCHDHKFDPIPTVDYYSIAGIFRSTEMFGDLVRNASKWMEYKLPTGDGNATVRVMAPREGTTMDLRVHTRGDRNNLGGLAPRRFLQVLAGEGHAPIQTNGSGRLELARWIANPKHPLTARVMVNRLWQGHFRNALVRSTDNFGMDGDDPTNPALLDWLAAEFVANEWSLKKMHRLMVLSNAYRQPRLQRLDAEQIRDAVLAASGQLDRQLGGNEIIEKAFSAGENIDKKRNVVSASTINSRWEGFESNRRSLYLPVVRNGQPDVLALFDAADANQVVAERGETTSPSQAAYLLNNPFIKTQAGHLASLLLKQENDDTARVRLLWRRCLNRSPTQREQADALAFVKDSELDANAAWQELCQAVFCFNEFVFLK